MTISKITFHPEAAAEVEAAFTWYQARSVRAAGSFLTALEEALEAIAASPERISGGIQVQAVAHGRRRPGYWRSRLP